MKKSVSILATLFFAFVCTFLFSGAAFADENSPFQTAPYGDGVMITKYDGDVSGTLVIPEKIDGKPVRCIDRKAFSSK